MSSALMPAPLAQSIPDSVCVGANVYYWGVDEQAGLLREGVRTWAREARQRQLAHTFWYVLYDARGPHVTLFFHTEPGKEEILIEFLERRISDFLQQSPSGTALAEADLVQRHRACRGRTMCAGDHTAGLAQNNSYLVFSQVANESLLDIARGSKNRNRFWNCMDRLAFWTLDSREASPVPGAVLWIAAVDYALHGLGICAAEYWHYHATTLLLGLDERFPSSSSAAASWLRNAVGAKNITLFSAQWNATAADGMGFNVKELLEMIQQDFGPSPSEQYSTLREINHVVLSRLGLWTKFEIPLVLYAWQRNL